LIPEERDMGGLSIWHMIILFGITMMVFGPKRLPEIGKGLGEAINGFKKGLSGNEIDVTKREKIDEKKDEEKKS
jgi:sec-independent protein translocase protein TatA